MLVCSIAPLARADDVAAVELRLVTSSGLRLRAAPSAEAAVLDKIPIGTVLECMERQNNFCRVRTGDKIGWYHEPHTAPLEKDRAAQERALIEKKIEELGVAHDGPKLADLYEFHRYLLRRIDAAPPGGAKLLAKLDELRLVRHAAHAFHADKRVYRDEAQGPRLKREAIWALVDEATAAKANDVAERAAWLAVEHARDFECEGDGVCIMSWWSRNECEYLKRFPSGAHVDDALKRIDEEARGVAQNPSPLGPMDKLFLESARDAIKEARACVAPIKSARAATVAKTLDDIERTLKAAKP